MSTGPSQPEAAQPEATQPGEQPWGRVDPDGNVFVRTADGERSVGQYPEGTPEEALAFFTKRFEDLSFEVHLLEQRVRAGAMSPEEARSSIEKVRSDVSEANAVGDLAGLVGRLDAMKPLLAAQREARKEERAKKVAASRGRKQQIAEEAEKLASGQDWRNGGNRLRDLLEEWKGLPRLDKTSDDELWRRFSSARTAYTKARKAHYQQLDSRHSEAKLAKQQLIKEAIALQDSTDWGPTSGKYRDLMARWKAAGPASRNDDDKLWKQFRAAQDVFFHARESANAAQDQEFAANAEKKEAILLEAEALIPVGDLEEAKRRFREIGERWEAAGKVPRNRMKELEGRIRKVEQAIRAVEDEQWQRSDPEKSARADDMVSQLERGVADLEAKIAATSDEKQIARLRDELAGKQQFLEMARKVSQDYAG